jgi:hypothetical protein
MSEVAGAWYVAQTRPAKDPIAQLLLALGNIVTSNIDLAIKKAKTVDEVGRRIAAIAKALDCTDTTIADELKKDFTVRLSAQLAPVPAGKTRPVLDTLALFRFVDETLDKLDAAMGSTSQRSGKPSLLIHIDQFEEVFRDETDANGREALMQLLRSVYEYAPVRLFVVATMRSEELHKCSEHEGIAEVVNSSMYLIDLVSQEEIQRAIVEPARRQATLWELPTNPSAASPFTPEAVRLLQRAYQEAGTAVQHTADQLPLLQHCLPLLWEAAVDDWILRRKSDSNAKFEITRGILEGIPGWIDDDEANQPISLKAQAKIGEWQPSQSRNNRLGRCLNAHANKVLETAFGKWREVDVRRDNSKALAVFRSSPTDLGFDDPSPEQAGLIAAFCCLAQLDDRGRAARRFVTLDDIVTASGLTQWKDRYSPDQIRRCLETALGEFERAGFIERIVTEQVRYNVNHEAFIRNWSSYEDWLDQKQFVQERLCEADPQAIRLSDRPRSWNPIDWILANNKRDAYAIIPDETGNRLRAVFGDKPIFSRAWVQDILAASDNVSKLEAQSSKTIISPEERFGKIRKIWRDAGWWRDNGWTRQTTAAILGMVLVVALGAIAVMLYQKIGEATKAQEVHKQLYNLIISVQAGAADLPTAVQYRELHTALRVAYDSAQSKSIGDNREALVVLRKTIFEADKAIRRRLSDVSVQFEDVVPFAKRVLTADFKDASCQVSNDNSHSLKGKGPGGADLGIVPAFGTFWVPVAGEALSKDDVRPDFLGGAVSSSPGGIICLSDDARWVLAWGTSLQPVLAQIVWSQQQDKGWLGKVVSQRFINSNANRNRLGDRRIRDTFDYLADGATFSGRKQVRYFSHDGVVGFTLPVLKKDDPHLLIWSVSGLNDPDDSIQKDGRGWPACGYVAVEARSGPAKVNECKIPVNIAGQVNIADGGQSLAITYGDNQPGCADPKPGVDCQSTIELRFEGASQTGASTRSVSLRLLHKTARITNAKLEGGWLWLYDANNKTWRYLVEKNMIDPLLELRWMGVTWQEPGKPGVDNYLPSDECQGFPDCLKYLQKPEGSWPGPPVSGQGQ